MSTVYKKWIKQAVLSSQANSAKLVQTAVTQVRTLSYVMIFLTGLRFVTNLGLNLYWPCWVYHWLDHLNNLIWKSCLHKKQVSVI